MTFDELVSNFSAKNPTHSDLYFSLVEDAAFSWLGKPTAAGRLFGVTTSAGAFSDNCAGSSSASSETKRKP